MEHNFKADNRPEKLLKQALSEIENNMKLKDLRTPMEDKHVVAIIQRCNETFKALQKQLVEPYSEEGIKRSNEDVRKLARNSKEWNFLGSPEELMQSYDASKYKMIFDQVSYAFPTFMSRDPVAPISKMLFIQNQDSTILRILPYLLTAYYFNLFGCKRIRMTVSSQNNDNYNYGRDLLASCKLFSYENFLPEFYKSGRKSAPNTIEKITNTTELIRSLITNTDGVGKLQYVQVYKVFIHSVIATACFEEFSGTPYKIDAKATWELFDKHTSALATVLSLHCEFEKIDKQLANELRDHSLFTKMLLSAMVSDLISNNKNNVLYTIQTLNEWATHMSAQNVEHLKVSFQNCNLDLPPDLYISSSEEDVYQRFAYSLRFLLNPFFLCDSAAPIHIMKHLLETDKKGAVKNPPRMPYMVIHSRAKKSATSTDEAEN